MKVEFYKHNIWIIDVFNLLKVLKGIFLTTWKTVDKFERKLSLYTWNKYSIWMKSCTIALFLSLKYFNIWKWDEVITTPLSFVSTANSIEHTWAKPVFVDVDKKTWNIDLKKIEWKITSKTKAIIVVHLYWQMVDIVKLKWITDKYNIKIIEDSAHCVEWENNWIRPWNISNCACFSFSTIKNITSWEWGAISTNDKSMSDWLKKARLHWISKSAAQRYGLTYEHYDMEFLWYKSNMTNIDASLLLNQIDNIDKLLLKRERISQKYNDWFKNNENIGYPDVLLNWVHARHLYTILIKDSWLRDTYIYKLQKAWIWVAVNFRTIHLMSYYKKKYSYKRGDFPNAEFYWDATISIPLYPKLRNSEINYIIKIINSINYAT